MKTNYIHRRARGRWSLCRNPYDIDFLTIDDEKVTCPKCIEILTMIKNSNTKTTTIQKVIRRK